MACSRYPVDTERKLYVHKTSWTSSERLMSVQFTSCVYWVIIVLKRPILDVCGRPGHTFETEDVLEYIDQKESCIFEYHSATFFTILS